MAVLEWIYCLQTSLKWLGVCGKKEIFQEIDRSKAHLDTIFLWIPRFYQIYVYTFTSSPQRSKAPDSVS